MEASGRCTFHRIKEADKVEQLLLFGDQDEKRKKYLEDLWRESTPLEFFFQEQSYSSLHSGQSSAWDHVRGDIDDPCGAIADFCGVIADFCGVNADPCGVVAIPEAIGGRRSLRDSLNIIKHRGGK